MMRYIKVLMRRIIQGCSSNSKLEKLLTMILSPIWLAPRSFWTMKKALITLLTMRRHCRNSNLKKTHLKSPSLISSNLRMISRRNRIIPSLLLPSQFCTSSMNSFIPTAFIQERNSKFEALHELSDEFVFARFPDFDDEESYQKFRKRERKEIALHDYSYGYKTTTKFGDLIVRQRLKMVKWMVEHCDRRKNHDETLFLGVNLMDRFLSRGCFHTKRNLQLLGIACVTLAMGIEENQAFNNTRKKYFTVGTNLYKRCEVVSMEWMVLQVLSFQCSIPTTHSFLWFYLKAARANAQVENFCRHLAILMLFDHAFLRFWPSTVAAGLIILACLATDNDYYCDVVLETHLRSKTDDLAECIQRLKWLVKYVTLLSENGS